MHRCGAHTLLVSAVGADALGSLLLEHAAATQPTPMSTAGLRRVAGARTGTYTAMMDGGGDLTAAVADMDVLGSVSPSYLARFGAELEAAPLIVADANLAEGTLVELAGLALKRETPLWLEPVSTPKAVAAIGALRAAGLLRTLTFASPNEDEALAMAAALRANSDGAAGVDVDADDESILAAAKALVSAGIEHVLVTRGARGVLWVRGAGAQVTVEELAALPPSRLVSTRGAGDCFVAGVVAGLVGVAGLEAGGGAGAVRDAVRCGLRAARLSLESEAAVPAELCASVLGTTK